METAQRIRNLPPYLFAEIDRKIAEAKARGVDVISLGIGDPDRPTPENIVDRLVSEAKNPRNHRYPSYEGLKGFRQAVAEWYRRRFGVGLDPDKEIVSLIGSKEGIAHISLCFVDPGDVNLIPDPAYPVYGIGTLLAGGEAYLLPLRAERGYLPDLAAIPSDVARRSKLMFLNYPNNPTAAVASLGFFREVVDFARQHNIVVCHDGAYSEVTFDGYEAPSFLQAPGAKDVGIEFHSLSKTYNMTGWRIGWAAGSAAVIEALGRVKTNVDSGVFEAIQHAGIEALLGSQDSVQRMCDLYRRRRDLVVEALAGLGWRLEEPKASIYIWAPTPSGYTSKEFAALLLEKAGVVVAPGIGYGPNGEGYFRISLTLEDSRIGEALDRIKASGIKYP
ncbi:MAG: LL-diaminopimelate aminotransferase [Firmicutes bacterium]|nr:LL-diaminopimelate aminotransferase [Bacillota bacterium]